MSQVVIVYWRDIPAQIVVGSGRRVQAKRLLPERFQQAIDIAAMRGDARDGDTYLAEWRRGEPIVLEGDAETAADAWLEKLDREWAPDRLMALARAGGRLSATGEP